MMQGVDFIEISNIFKYKLKFLSIKSRAFSLPLISFLKILPNIVVIGRGRLVGCHTADYGTHLSVKVYIN